MFLIYDTLYTSYPFRFSTSNKPNCYFCISRDNSIIYSNIVGTYMGMTKI